MAPPSSSLAFGGAWTRLSASTMLADALASTALADFSATPSHSPKTARTLGRDH